MGNALISRRSAYSSVKKYGDLYNYGEVNEETGGWGITEMPWIDYFGNVREPMTNMGTYYYGELATYWSIKFMGTTNKVNLTPYSTLNMLYEYKHSLYASAMLYVKDNNNPTFGYSSSGVLASVSNSGVDYTGILTLDIRALLEGHVFAAICDGAASGGAGATLKVYRIWRS